MSENRQSVLKHFPLTKQRMILVKRIFQEKAHTIYDEISILYATMTFVGFVPFKYHNGQFNIGLLNIIILISHFALILILIAIRIVLQNYWKIEVTKFLSKGWTISAFFGLISCLFNMVYQFRKRNDILKFLEVFYEFDVKVRNLADWNW